MINSDKNPTINEKISCARALYSAAQNQKIPKRFVDMLISYSNSDDKNLRHRAVSAMMIWLNKVKRVQKSLISCARQSDENKNLVLGNVTPIIKNNEEFCLKVLNVCSNTDDQHFIHGVGLGPGHIAPKYPIEVLMILKKWCKKQGFYLGQRPKWAHQYKACDQLLNNPLSDCVQVRRRRQIDCNKRRIAHRPVRQIVYYRADYHKHCAKHQQAYKGNG